MRVLEVRNVQEALPNGLELLSRQGKRRESRNGPVMVYPGPVTTVYHAPTERVIFWSERDANPFFHLMEGLWMLAGRNDVAFLTNYVKRMSEFSDDGKILHGAYGHRWIHHFLIVAREGEEENRVGEINQIATIIKMLKHDPDDRRCVLQMWDASVDLGRGGKDVPCNTQAYFSRGSSGALDMTVCCRSNDMIWGAYGANAVHFSMLQEFMAAAIGCEVGFLWQISNNYHAYVKTMDPIIELANFAADPFRQTRNCPYHMNEVEAFPMVSTPVEEWMQDLYMLLDEGVTLGLRDRFFRRVVIPMMQAHKAYRMVGDPDRYLKALEILSQCRATDWRRAAEEWIRRRQERAKQ